MSGEIYLGAQASVKPPGPVLLWRAHAVPHPLVRQPPGGAAPLHAGAALDLATGPTAYIVAVAFGGFFFIAALVGILWTMGERTRMERFVRYRQGTFSPIETPGLISFLRGLPRIDVSALPPADRLALAVLIRDAVRGAAVG